MDAAIKFQTDKLGWWCSVCAFGASFDSVLEAQMMAEMHKHWRTDRTIGLEEQ